jgi:protein SCO1/2
MLAAPEGAWTHPAEQHASGEEAAFQLEGGNGQLSENTPGFLEREGNMVPMDTEFTTSDGETVTLAELAGNGERPLVLNLQYYDCPNLCGQILIDQAETLSQVSRVAGEDYQLVTLSIAPNETPELAAEIKNRTLGMLESAFPEEGWSFLTGDKGNIDRVAESIGFQYRRKGESYAHPMGLVFVSPHGKVTRYVHGLDYLPAVVNMSIMEATTGTVQPAVAKVLQLCFQTSPEGNTIAFKAKQVTGAVTITFASVFGLFLFRRGRIRRRTYGPDSEEEQS